MKNRIFAPIAAAGLCGLLFAAALPARAGDHDDHDRARNHRRTQYHRDSTYYHRRDSDSWRRNNQNRVYYHRRNHDGTWQNNTWQNNNSNWNNNGLHRGWEQGRHNPHHHDDDDRR